MPYELGEPDEWISEERRDRDRLHRDVLNTGGCANPVHLRTIRVDKATGELKVRDLRIACKDRRAALCPSCSARFKADAWFLATSGKLGGKGLPSDVATHPKGLLHPDRALVRRGPHRPRRRALPSQALATLRARHADIVQQAPR